MNINNSQRLRFQLMQPSDADLLYELDQDPEVLRYVNRGRVITREDIQNISLPRLEKYTNPENGWGMWKVTINESDTFIGWIIIRPMGFFSETPEFDNLEIGWRFKRAAWGKGYATEAAKRVMQEVGAYTTARTFSAIAMKENAASINIMKKLGLKHLKNLYSPRSFRR